jgi:ribosomal protein S18 acetylase RimI-like enzyme
MEAKRMIMAGAETLIQRVRFSKQGITFEIILYAKPANLLDDYEFRSCLELIAEGEAVNTDSATEELRKGRFTGIAKIEGKYVGTGSIKRQRPIYAAGISRKSNYSFDPNLHELGYVAVDPSHRGKNIAQTVVEHLLFAFCKPTIVASPPSPDKPIPPHSLFATTSNEGMKIILERMGFERRGTEWPSVNGDPLSLWLFESKAIPWVQAFGV